MTEPAAEPILLGTLSEVAAHAKREADAGDIGRILNLMEVAREIGGEAGSDMVYENVIRPRLQARWDAWLNEEPGAAQLSRDEIRMMLVIAIDGMEPAQAEGALARLRECVERHSGTPDKGADEE